MSTPNAAAAFEEKSVSKLVLRNVVPSMLAMLMALIYNLADIFFIGRTHNDILVASVSLATPVFLLFMAVGSLFGMGGTSIISRDLGAGKTEHARKVSAFCMWGCVFCGILLSVLLWGTMDGLLSLLGASPDTVGPTKQYLNIVIACGTFSMISTCYSNILRAEGKSSLAMWGTLIGNLLNIVFDPILILGAGLGIRGAAFATVIGNSAAALFYIVYFLTGKSQLSIHIKNVTVKEGIAKGVFMVGFPAAINSLLMSLSQIIINSEMAKYGDMAVAAYGVAAKLLMIIATMSMGIGQGVQPVLGYCYGAKDKRRFQESLRFALILAGVFCAVLAALVIVFAEPIVKVFLTDQNALSLGISFTRIMIAVDWVFGIICVLTNALQAIEAGVPALLISLCRQGIIFIPVVLIMGALGSMQGLVWAQPIADLATLLLTVILFRRSKKKVDQYFGQTDDPVTFPAETSA